MIPMSRRDDAQTAPAPPPRIPLKDKTARPLGRAIGHGKTNDYRDNARFSRKPKHFRNGTFAGTPAGHAESAAN